MDGGQVQHGTSAGMSMDAQPFGKEFLDVNRWGGGFSSHIFTDGPVSKDLEVVFKLFGVPGTKNPDGTITPYNADYTYDFAGARPYPNKPGYFYTIIKAGASVAPDALKISPAHTRRRQTSIPCSSTRTPKAR